MQIWENWSCDLREACFSCEHQSHVSVFSRNLLSSSSELHRCCIILLRARKVTDSLIRTERVGKRGICRSLKDRAGTLHNARLAEFHLSGGKVSSEIPQSVSAPCGIIAAAAAAASAGGTAALGEIRTSVGSYCLECVCAAPQCAEGRIVPAGFHPLCWAGSGEDCVGHDDTPIYPHAI